MDSTEQKAAKAVTGDMGKNFTVTVNSPGILHRMGILPHRRTYTVRPLTLGTLMRVSELMSNIDFDPGAPDLWGEWLKTSAQAGTMAEIVAVAVANARHRPAKKLTDFFLDNLTAKQLLEILGIVVSQLDIKSFMISIASVTGVSLISRGS